MEEFRYLLYPSMRRRQCAFFGFYRNRQNCSNEPRWPFDPQDGQDWTVQSEPPNNTEQNTPFVSSNSIWSFFIKRWSLLKIWPSRLNRSSKMSRPVASLKISGFQPFKSVRVCTQLKFNCWTWLSGLDKTSNSRRFIIKVNFYWILD